MARYRFDDIAYNITDKRMPTPDDRELYIGLEHLDTRCLRVSRWGSAVDITGQKLVMRKGDLLFGRRNTYLRRAAIAPHDGLFSAHGMIFRPKTDVITEEFFPYFIVSNYFMDAAIRISVGSLSPTVNWKQLKELEFDIPDIDKQHKYAELFAAVDRTKESYRQLILSTDELVKSQFIEMLTPYAEAGKVVLIQDMVKSDRPVTYGIVKPGTNYEGGIPVVRVKDFTDGIIHTDDMLHTRPELNAKYLRSTLLEGDILLSIGGTIGRVAIVPKELEGANITQHTARISLKSKYDPVYVKGVLESPLMQEVMAKNTLGVAQVGLNLKDIRVFPVPDVHQEEQSFLAAFYRQADKSKFEAQQALESLDVLYQNMEKQCFC